MSIAELFVILIVALVVINPERLPEVTYNLGRFIGRCKRWYQHLVEKYNQLL